MRHITDEHGLVQVLEAGVRLVRYEALRWDQVEPDRTTPPTYHWQELQSLEQDLLNAARLGIDLTVLVSSTPAWAQALPGHSCAPIREDALIGFAQFLQAVVERYGSPPYNVKYWELFNEPDIDPSLVRANSVFGCWGDEEDEYYGGRTYGRMLQAAYPAIKAADPEAQVIHGGLLLDAPDTLPTMFLTGVLEAGGGDFFDVLAFHAYTFYTPDEYQWSTAPGTKWTDWGGVVVGKSTYLRQVLEGYGYDKPLLLNEAGLAWISPGDPTEEYRQAQADYVVKLYSRGLALDLAAITWWGWQGPGWRQMALLNKDLSPTPAYYAYSYAGQQLSGVEYLGPTDYPGIEGYAFRRNEQLLQVLWSIDGDEHSVRFSAGQFVAAFDLMGEQVIAAQDNGAIILTVRRPVYVELAFDSDE